MRAAAVQLKFAATVEGNLAKVEAALAQAARRKVDTVLFPECATTGYNRDFAKLSWPEVQAALKRIGALAAKHGVNVLLGSPVFRRGHWQNCLVVFDRRGRVVHCYAKCQLTERDREFFTPGNSVALFKLDGILCTAIICHERRYPELVRLGVMAGARIAFHPNAGLDPLAVSRHKRGGRDGIAVRAFENAVFYVFANSVGPQGDGLWSAGDSKIVAPNSRVLALADNRSETVITADLDLAQATGKYAADSRAHPRFLAADWRRIVKLVCRQAKKNSGLE
ncbi:MAG: nitrilase/cyanide hydratase and apolipoprotein N-acyltransferase [Limisphaerales bacterium]|nr:MAG: nitrilase/cyanide hydratase and apolipoprotein N-acyltransferase [Limisphaerales bacterium]KAG0508876.1 MAG: nitrilase/cyanide hydratase and apolipoprotein N-acyltransferase [Limisphaerales bacterium]TXT50217.1 MAG: nitrilase/cyanide hydratase and apolipoprotein N-acyltransferase [Limisphaerales bacterium]